MNACTHAHTHARSLARTHVRTHARTRIHMHARTYTCTHARTHACTNKRTHVHTDTRMHARTHARTHTHTHTHTPWSQWFRSGSVIDRRSTAENCQHRGPSRWHGGNFKHVQNFRSATAGWANVRIAAAPPLPPQHRRDTTMTAVAPYKDHSSTSITAVHPQYNRRAIAKK